MAVAQKRVTLEEFLQLPEKEPALEYFDGVVEQKMSPKTRHSALQGELVVRITAAAQAAKIARVFPELRTTFGGKSYQDHIDLGSVIPAFDLTVEQLFTALSG